MEVWKPPNYRLPDVRKGNELEAQLLLINRRSSCGKNNYWYTDPIGSTYRSQVQLLR